jgi:(p)ppGpp synthase/HD superfamily hydrolase
MLSKAIRIASEAFENKYDKGGKPYILHCLHVMNEVSCLGVDAMIIAVLHDYIEDKKGTQESLTADGFSFSIIRRIFLLTHDKQSESYDEYIKRVASDKICVAIKLADLKHNSDITRLKGLTKKDFDRLEKYCKAYTYLKETI